MKQSDPDIFETILEQFDPEVFGLVHDVHVDKHPVLEGTVSQCTVTYNMQELPGMPVSPVEGVLYGPDVLYGYESCGDDRAPVPVLMCIGTTQCPIAWSRNGEQLCMNLAHLSIVRPLITGPGKYICVVSGKIVGAVNVDNAYKMSLLETLKPMKVNVQFQVKEESSPPVSSVMSTQHTSFCSGKSWSDTSDSALTSVSSSGAKAYADIEESQLEIGSYINEGSGGTVYKASYLDRPVAAKRLTLGNKKSSKVFLEIESELRVHAMLHCDSIVQLIGCCTVKKKGNVAYIVTEFVNGPDLDTFLFGSEREWENLYQSLTPDQLNKMAFDMCSAVAYMHESQEQPIIHRDLKPGNFVIRLSDMAVKLIDLGIGKVRQAKTMGRTAFAKEIAGTWSYCAPEKLMGGIDGNIPIDIWGLGACLTELFTRAEIWDVPDEEDETTFIKGEMDKHREPHALAKMRVLDSDSPHLQLLSQALSYEPKNRPCARQIAKHFKKQLPTDEL